jgi:ribosome-binding factor A
MNSIKPYNRMERISVLVLASLSEITLQYVNLSNLGLVTFTSVDVAPDLKTAKVFYSVLGKKKKAMMRLISI